MSWRIKARLWAAMNALRGRPTVAFCTLDGEGIRIQGDHALIIGNVITGAKGPAIHVQTRGAQ